jgi:alpha-ketoglutarate-dependent taurine dioxygenase
MVKSAALYCVTKAAEGGESTVFNAVAALVALCEEDIELVLPLFHPQALTRNGSAELSAVTAPAFVLGDGELRTRYSVDYTSTWNVDCVAGLRESFDRLEALSCVGSSFYSETMLEAGELFIMANDRIAHGRRGFRNSETITRRLGRALFLDTVKA